MELEPPRDEDERQPLTENNLTSEQKSSDEHQKNKTTLQFTTSLSNSQHVTNLDQKDGDKNLERSYSNLRSLARLTTTPASRSKRVQLGGWSDTTMSAVSLRRNTSSLGALVEPPPPRTAERTFSYDPCRMTETPLTHHPQTLYLLATSNPQPASAPPIKAWRGYGGNVYFEPVNLKPVSFSSRSTPSTLQLYDLDSQLQKRNSLSQNLINYYQSNKNYSYRLPKSVPTVHYDTDMIENLNDKPGRSQKNWVGEERKWMRGLKSTASLKLPRNSTGLGRSVGSTGTNVAALNEAILRSSSKRRINLAPEKTNNLETQTKTVALVI